MALITCPECKNEVSEKSLMCPKCGFPMSPDNHNIDFDKENNSNTSVLGKKRIVNKKTYIVICIILVAAILTSGVWLFLNYRCNPIEQMMIECGLYLKSTLKDPDSLKLTEAPILVTYNSSSYEHPFTYINLSYSATNSYGARVSNHAFFYVKPDRSSWKYVGDESALEIGADYDSKEIAQLALMVNFSSGDTDVIYEEFSVDKISRKVGCIS